MSYLCICSGIQREFKQHDKYQQARKDFMGKAFVHDGETQIEKDLKAKFQEVDMKVSSYIIHTIIVDTSGCRYVVPTSA